MDGIQNENYHENSNIIHGYSSQMKNAQRKKKMKMLKGNRKTNYSVGQSVFNWLFAVGHNTRED